MSAESINSLSALTTHVGKPAQTVRFAAGGEDSFRMGEIVRARVLRQTGENRYALQFKGGERQVDSVIPFRTGDILYGRVVGLGSQVEVERVRVERGESGRPDFGGVESSRVDVERQVGAEFSQRLRNPLSAEEMRIIDAFKGGAEKNYLANLAGLALRNVGIGVSSAGIEGILSAMGAKGGRGVFPPVFGGANAESVEATPIDATPGHETQALQLALLIKQLVEHIPEAKAHKEDAANAEAGAARHEPQPNNPAFLPNRQGGQQDRDEELDLARWMLNVESGSSVGHRINTIPLLVNGQLVELNVALFEDGESGGAPGAAIESRYKSFVMSFSTPYLGRLEIRATAHGKNLSFSLTANREAVAEQFAASAAALKGEFEKSNWNVTEMTYRHGDSTLEASSHAVLCHLANLDRYEIYV